MTQLQAAQSGCDMFGEQVSAPPSQSASTLVSEDQPLRSPLFLSHEWRSQDPGLTGLISASGVMPLVPPTFMGFV